MIAAKYYLTLVTILTLIAAYGCARRLPGINTLSKIRNFIKG